MCPFESLADRTCAAEMGRATRSPTPISEEMGMPVIRLEWCRNGLNGEPSICRSSKCKCRPKQKTADGSLAPRSTCRLQVWGVDTRGERFLQNAHARDVSLSGALLSGLDAELTSGDVIGILFAGKKARFRVVWIRYDGAGEKMQAAVHRFDTDECPWLALLSEEPARLSQESLLQSLSPGALTEDRVSENRVLLLSDPNRLRVHELANPDQPQLAPVP